MNMLVRIFINDYFFIWLALVIMGLLCRPLTPVDETRVASVAWEMWQSGDFLMPRLNGLPYSHKPPLLQWCIHLFWSLCGVSEWSARIIAPLFALGNLVLTAKLSRQLWPNDETSPQMAPLLLLALPVWSLWTSLTLYDMLATFFTLLALHGIIRSAQGGVQFGWVITGLAIGLGVLSKGPAILVMVLPPALFAPWWLMRQPEKGWRVWYGSIFKAVLIGATLALAWAVPAGLAGGEDYRRLIFWGQTAGRISNSFAHQRPYWWYFAALPVACLPWLFWPPLWRIKSLSLDSGMRFCATQIVFALGIFSFISGKQIHYLLPLLPILALLVSRALSLANLHIMRKDQAPFSLLLALSVVMMMLPPLSGLSITTEEAAEIALKTPFPVKLLVLGIGCVVLAWRPATPLSGVRTITYAMLGLMLGAHLIFLKIGWPYYSMQNFADRLSTVEKTGAPIAYWGKYNGDFNFLGRLQHPLVEINDKQKLLDWIDTNREGYVVLIRHPDPSVSENGADFAQFYRGSRRVMLWKASELPINSEYWQGLLN